MQRVKLVSLGENLPISLSDLSDTLNSLQSHFQFEVGSAIPIALLGEPDYLQQWYFIDRLFNTIRQRDASIEEIMTVGITHLRITEQEYKDGDEGNRDFFSSSDYKSIAVVGLNKNVTQFNSMKKTIYQFTSFLIVAELLNISAKRDLYHIEVDHCLFDDCVDRSSIQPAIERSWICERCMGKLKENGVSGSPIEATRKILDWCRKDIGKNSVVIRTLTNPLSTYVFGSVSGWGLSEFFSRSNWPLILIPSVLIVVSIYIILSLKHSKRSSPKNGLERQ